MRGSCRPPLITPESSRVNGAKAHPPPVKRSRKKGDLPEYLVALAAKRAGVTKTQTFNRPVCNFNEFEVFSTRTKS